jgi:hypothetical protein
LISNARRSADVLSPVHGDGGRERDARTAATNDASADVLISNARRWRQGVTERGITAGSEGATRATASGSLARQSRAREQRHGCLVLGAGEEDDDTSHSI